MRPKFAGLIAAALIVVAAQANPSSAAYCGACAYPSASCSPDQYRLPVVRYRVCYQDVVEDQPRVCFRPVYRTVLKERCVTTCQPVIEQHLRECHYTCTRPVCDVEEVMHKYSVCKPVYEQHFRQCRYTVCKPVLEETRYPCGWSPTSRSRSATIARSATRFASLFGVSARCRIATPRRESSASSTMRECHYIVMTKQMKECLVPVMEVPVTSYRMVQEPRQMLMRTCTYEPVWTEKCVKVSSGYWRTEQEFVPGPMTRKCCQLPGAWSFDPCTCTSRYCPGPVISYGVQAPGHCECKRVWVPCDEFRKERTCQMVPRECCRAVTYMATKAVPCTTLKEVPCPNCQPGPGCCCKMVPWPRLVTVPEEKVRLVPYTVRKTICEEHCKMVKQRQCEMVKEQKVRVVPYVTCKIVPQESIKMVPSASWKSVPEERVQCVPYLTCRMVTEERCEVIRRPRVRMVTEERVCYVPFTTCRMERQQRVQMIPCTVCTLEPYCETCKVCRRVPVCVPVNATP